MTLNIVSFIFESFSNLILANMVFSGDQLTALLLVSLFFFVVMHFITDRMFDFKGNLGRIATMQ